MIEYPSHLHQEEKIGMNYSGQIEGNWKRALAALALAGLISLALAACDSGATATPTIGTGAGSAPAETAPTATTEMALEATATSGTMAETPATSDDDGDDNGDNIEVDLKEWAVDLEEKELSAGKVVFEVGNDGKFTHNAVILDSAGGEVARTPNFKGPEGLKILEVDLTAGTYKMICDIPNHAEQGMTTDFTVK